MSCVWISWEIDEVGLLILMAVGTALWLLLGLVLTIVC